MNDKAIISETIEHQIKVLQLLEELGYMWWSNHKPTKIVPLAICSDDKVIYIDVKNQRLSISDLRYLARVQATRLTYEELLRQRKKVVL